MEELQQAKNILSSTILMAREAGLPETDVAEADKLRRTTHNCIQDLRGSIRVYARVRPISGQETANGDSNVMEQVDAMTLSLQSRDAGSHFSFDAVFMPGSQDEIFDNCRDLVQSAIDGYNVTMFAYGQTGAGKTYTMSGSPGDEGMAPRTAREVFRIIDDCKERIDFCVTASMCELYRNDLVDLLVASPKFGSEPLQKLNVRMEKSGAVTIDNLTEEECMDMNDIMRVLTAGTARRRVAATAMNTESSRSHSILTIRISSRNNETGEGLYSKILLCDLAGSERLKKYDYFDDVQKEGIEINKSLTALGDVIEALTKRQSQIPYRNHKLTQVMSDSLGGSAKTLMFVNCSPSNSNSNETLMSLRFSSRAKRVTNQVTRQKSPRFSSRSSILSSQSSREFASDNLIRSASRLSSQGSKFHRHSIS